jgi:hypothetical protein
MRRADYLAFPEDEGKRKIRNRRDFPPVPIRLPE